MQSTIISIDTASAITEFSRRTWWRRISAGEVTRVADDDRGRAMLLWSEVEPHICVPIEQEDKNLSCWLMRAMPRHKTTLGNFS